MVIVISISISISILAMTMSMGVWNSSFPAIAIGNSRWIIEIIDNTFIIIIIIMINKSTIET